MAIGTSLVQFATRRPGLVTGAMVLMTLVLATLAALPTIAPATFPRLAPARVDTDPENMLAKDEPVRVFHDAMKKELALYDMIVLGIVNERHPQGVFNPESLARIHELTQYAKTLVWQEPSEEGETALTVGVIEADVIAPSTVDNIEQAGPGAVSFEWLMSKPPETDAEALAVRDNAFRIPFLKGTLVSDDGKAICLYLPLTSKDLSYRVYAKLQEKIATLSGDEEYHITGLPVAEDTFGVEMFKQMAISAPVAMVIIFLLMLVFFRKIVLIISPMIVAMVSVISTMGLLLITGNTIHIMSSMIPIFIMPIAVLDAIHILSDFFDRYQKTRDRRQTIHDVMHDLFTPMLYTSLTTAAGFASLALTPIPPVQVFGLFVALGVMLAWLLTVTFIPSFVMFIPERKLANFGATHQGEEGLRHTILSRVLAATGRATFRNPKVVAGLTAVVVAVAIFGITRIRINDNPTRWFAPSHPIRVAEQVLNKHFGGTYMAYLALEAPETGGTTAELVATLSGELVRAADQLKEEIPQAPAVFRELASEAIRLAETETSPEKLLDLLDAFAQKRIDEGPEEEYFAWDEASLSISRWRQRAEVFKSPEALRYIEDLQTFLASVGVVGKSNSLADIVKTVHRELLSGDPEELRIPDSPEAVAQCLITYQNSHRPQDLWHFTTPDYRKASLWLQLTSGDNRDMQKVLTALDEYSAKQSEEGNAPPFGITHRWFGLTYINVIWQEKMVSGMLQAFLGSFLVVLLMMTILFRSALWGLLCMIPLMVTITAIYGAIGLVGKDYDMPVAVLSSLSLGLAVDYAIHFLSRARALQERVGSWPEAVEHVFAEPARAIARNVLAVGVGFLPLLLAPLVPYQTVGIFIASILVAAGAATLLILPALMTMLEGFLFPQTRLRRLTCRCATCLVSGVVAVALVSVNLHQFLNIGWKKLTWYSLAAVLVVVALCAVMSRRRSCATEVKGDPS